ncbi:MAG: hypothetical protein DRQ40_01750, partial [Gammaproteobacteria bacterium]
MGASTRGATVAGQPVSYPKAQGFNIRIGDIWFRTIANPAVPLTIGTRDSLAERQDRSGSIYENVLDIGYAWSRTDLSGGEGLDWDPRELALFQDQAALDQIRFFSSNGIDVSRPRNNGEQYALRLSHSHREWEPVFGNPRDLGVSSDSIFVANGALVAQYQSWENITPLDSWTVLSPVFAMAVSPNGTVMVTCENGYGYVKGPEDTAFVEFYKDAGAKLIARGIWFVHGRFMMSVWD